MTPASPRAFVEEIARDLPPGRALDLACGDGRNALWLADRGWQVTAVDRAPSIRDSRITVHTADLERHQFSITRQAWDLILMSYYLQPDLFAGVARGLAPGGTAIVIVHLLEPGHERSRFSLHPGELRRHFEALPNLAILEYREERPAGGRLVAQIAVRAIH